MLYMLGRYLEGCAGNGSLWGVGLVENNCETSFYIFLYIVFKTVFSFAIIVI
jgi:hypothetical protein